MREGARMHFYSWLEIRGAAHALDAEVEPRYGDD